MPPADVPAQPHIHRPRSALHAGTFAPSSLTFMPPTSPLAQSSSPDDAPYPARVPPRRSSFSHSPSSSRSVHRFSCPSLSPPHSLLSLSSYSSHSSHSSHPPLSSLPSSHSSHPSLSSHPFSHPSSPPARRPSADPLVGSYEESLLRGRMSTPASYPLPFIAQLGVLAHGKCKPALRCPPHLSLPFHAVFYTYPRSADGPGPYVGAVDLDAGPAADSPPPSRTAPPGAYRIPPRGHVQVLVKNPLKTAVKLFLVPYDLSGMPPGTKTFLRQRSYSCAPPPPSGTPAPPARPVLRYLVHLNICCPAKGRFYLYRDVRLVFASRVPDEKDALTTETTWPEPRFTAYRPARRASCGAAADHQAASPPAFRPFSFAGASTQTAEARQAATADEWAYEKLSPSEIGSARAATGLLSRGLRKPPEPDIAEQIER